MVKYISIIKAIDDYLKCHDYPKINALRNFNPDDFQEEIIDSKFKFDPGKLERRQRELQKSVNYNDMDKGVVGAYNTTYFSQLQKYLNGTDDWKDESIYDFGNGKYGIVIGYPTYDMVNDGEGHLIAQSYKFHTEDLTMNQYAKALHEVCEKSPSLEENTVLYRYGRIPDDILEGGHGRFKGFTGTCFGKDHLEGTIDQLTQWADPDTRYKLKIYAPKGTKGVTLTHECGAENPYQNEFLIDKGQRFIVLSRNDKTREATILLY